MPPLPTNAPTTGTPALTFWTLAGLAIFVFVLIKLLPTGKERLNARQKRDNDAISVLQDRVASMEREIAGLKREMKRMGKNEEYNREYRHKLANQANALFAWGEIAYGLFEQMFEEWKECPRHYRRQLEQMGRPKVILERYPLPEKRQVEESELDDE